MYKEMDKEKLKCRICIEMENGDARSDICGNAAAALLCFETLATHILQNVDSIEGLPEDIAVDFVAEGLKGAVERAKLRVKNNEVKLEEMA